MPHASSRLSAHIMVGTERANCKNCRQHAVLGHFIANDVFRCHACMDEHGDDLLQGDLDSSGADDVAVNWWACEQAPAELDNVPDGALAKQTVLIDSQALRIVTDPNHVYFSGHGADCVWPAARALGEYFLRQTDMDLVGARIVELGAGVGLPGLVLGRCGAQVILTDVPWLLQLAEYNVQANFAPGDYRRPYVAPLRWGCASDVAAIVAQGTPDLVIGADIVYREEDVDLLLETIASIGAERAILSVRRRDTIVPKFIAKIAEHTWDFNVWNATKAVVLISLMPHGHLSTKEKTYIGNQMWLGPGRVGWGGQ